MCDLDRIGPVGWEILDRPGCRVDQTVYASKERGFPRPGKTDHRDKLAMIDRQVYIHERAGAVRIGFTEAGDLQLPVSRREGASVVIGMARV
jgi:hypothetical protein